MVLQTNNLLERDIQRSGCYLMSLLAMAQIEGRLALNVDDINNLYKQALENNYINKECRVMDPDKILKLAFRYIGISKKIYQIGTYKPDINKKTYWDWVKTENKVVDWYICEFKTTGRYGTHFTLRDRKSGNMYDPLQGVGYTATGINKLVMYHIFQ